MACSSSTAPAITAAIAGTWALNATASNSTIGVTCNVRGQATFTQTDSTFTGQLTNSTQTCSGPPGTASGSADGAITSGQISGLGVAYVEGSCSYIGTVSSTGTGGPNPLNNMQGTVSCQSDFQGTSYTFTGPWSATR